MKLPLLPKRLLAMLAACGLAFWSMDSATQAYAAGVERIWLTRQSLSTLSQPLTL